MALAGLVAGASGRPTAAEVERLSESLRALYEGPHAPWERWRRGSPTVTLPDGGTGPREQAYRDRPDFVAAAARLMASGTGDEGPLGAWLLGTAAPAQSATARTRLMDGLTSTDSRVAFEAACALARVGDRSSVTALERAARGSSSPDVRTAAAWAAARLSASGRPRPGGSLPAGFVRGVAWWGEGAMHDGGAASFRTLASMGIDWVSIHTWDPQQRRVDAPDFADPGRRYAIEGLPDLVKNAHAAGIKVVVKPHLEMRGYEPTPEEIRIFRSEDAAARAALVARIRAERAKEPPVWHNEIAMKTEADWQAWFASYERFVMDYARQAQAAGADAFCVGRELDKSAIARDADWRRIIAGVRGVFSGPLTYSANFDTYADVRFWDALDVIGVSAYFPLQAGADPSPADLSAAWDRVLAPLETLSRRTGKKVVFTEIGYPAVASAARAPWQEERAPADVWMQARCYEAALRAVSSRPWIVGTFWWLWEGVGQPPFRDPSFTIQGKPASFVLARWYAGLGAPSAP
jgi:nucleotide-binding universal stress UspA family protein